MAKMPDPLRLQHNVKQNAADIQSFIADLSSWEDGIKTKDKKLLKGDLNPTYKSTKAAPPVRKKGFAEMVPSGMPGPKDLERKKEAARETGDGRIQPKNYQEYGQWDKLEKNIDKWEEDFDEQTRQEYEDEHRNRMLAERRAIQEKEDAARKKVEDAEALKVLGNALLKTGDLPGALDKYCEAVATDPGNYVAWANAAHVRLELGQASEAVEACTKALDREPRYVKALLRRATALERLPPPAAATTEFISAEAYDGRKLGYVFKMDSQGLGYYVDKMAPNENLERAKNDLRQVLRLEPNNAQASAALERLAPRILTPEEEAEREAKAAERERKKAEAAAEEARREKERRKKERQAKKIMVRELAVDEAEDVKGRNASPPHAPAAVPPVAKSASPRQAAPGAAPAATAAESEGGQRGRALIEEHVVSAGAEQGDRDSKGETGAAEAGGKKVVTLEEAKLVAAAARKAVEERLSAADAEVPKTSVEFMRTWKRVNKDAAALQAFLLRIPPDSLAKIFRAELEEEVLVSIINNLDSDAWAHHPQSAVDMLGGLAKVKGLKMAWRFIGAQEKAQLARVLERLRGQGLTDFSAVQAAYA